MKHSVTLLPLVLALALMLQCSASRTNTPAATPRVRLHSTSTLTSHQANPAPTPTPAYVPMKPFPAQFTAKYQRYYTDFQLPQNTSGVIYQDQFNQRCRMTSVSSKKVPNSYLNVEQLAYFKPPYAQPGTAQASTLTLFNYGTRDTHPR